MSSWTWTVFVVSHDWSRGCLTQSQPFSIMRIYCSWNVLWVMLSRPLMWPCYRGDVMTLGFPMMIGGSLTTGRGSTWACFCQALHHRGWCHQGVVLVPVHIWKLSKISLANAYLYLHAHTAFVTQTINMQAGCFYLIR